MENQILTLNDVANELLILNKKTIDTLFELENCSDCIALYIFYYKTAKWQNTNKIKANDLYIKKSLKWGIDKIRKTKNILKEKGLIDIVQHRTNGKIDGWYIEVLYFVSNKKQQSIKVSMEYTNNTQNPQVVKATSGFQDINTNNYKLNTNNYNINTNPIPQKVEKYYQDDELNNLFLEFLDLRKKLKAINSNRAINMLLNKLSKYDDNTKKDMIIKSIVNSWKDVYEIKSKPVKEDTRREFVLLK